MSAGERSAKLEALADLMREHEEPLAIAHRAEAGKPIGYARGEIARCISTVRTAAAEALRFGGEVVPIDIDVGDGTHGVHASAFPVGRGGRDHAVQLPAQPGAPQGRTGHGRGLSGGAQARAAGTAQRPGACRAAGGGRLARRCVQRARVRHSRGRDSSSRMHASRCSASPAATRWGGTSSRSAGRRRWRSNWAATPPSSSTRAWTSPPRRRRVAMGANLYAGQTCISTQRIFVRARGPSTLSRAARAGVRTARGAATRRIRR